MKKVIVAFDVDGTLLQPEGLEANEDTRTLMRIFHGFQNVHVVLWSGSGELWARQAARLAHVDHWVDQYASKTERVNPDIAIDDKKDTTLGAFNLILGNDESKAEVLSALHS